MTENAVSIGITMECIKGESWPTESFKSFVDAPGDLTEDSVYFICPAGHKFTLTKALSKGIFTPEQSQKIMESARKLKEEWKKNLSVHRASDYIPNKDLEPQNIPCVRCGKKALRYLRKNALCLECNADFYNYFEKYAYEAQYVMFSARGKAVDLIWENIFSRFMQNLPALDIEEMKNLLDQCRKEAKRIRTKSKRP